MHIEHSLDGGASWRPVGVVRTTPGGPDFGQTDLPMCGKVALSSSLTTTVQLGTVTAGKTRLIADLEFNISASSCDVSIQAGGITIWENLLSGSLVTNRQKPLVIPAGIAVTLVFGAAATGTPNAYFNLGMWEH